MSARSDLSIFDFALSATPDAKDLMGILRAYADESGKASDAKCRCISMGAVIGRQDHWADFNQRWSEMCIKHDIPHLHMKELIGARHTKKGPFAKFLDNDKLEELLGNAVGCIVEADLYCCAMSVWVDDLKSSLRRHKLAADPYSFTLYQSIVSLGTWALNRYAEDPSFHLILDRIEQGTKKVAQAERLYETDNFAAWRGWPAVTALKPTDRQGSRDIRELQAADFVAWILRNQLLNIQYWMRNEKPKIGPSKMKEWDKSLDEWLQKRVEEQSAAYPEGVLFLRAWHSLDYWGRLKYRFYDEERIENHVMRGRTLECDQRLKERSIKAAGLFPLTP